MNSLEMQKLRNRVRLTKAIRQRAEDSERDARRALAEATAKAWLVIMSSYGWELVPVGAEIDLVSDDGFECRYGGGDSVIVYDRTTDHCAVIWEFGGCPQPIAHREAVLLKDRPSDLPSSLIRKRA